MTAILFLLFVLSVFAVLSLGEPRKYARPPRRPAVDGMRLADGIAYLVFFAAVLGAFALGFIS